MKNVEIHISSSNDHRFIINGDTISSRLLNKQKGKRKPEKGKGGKLMTGTIVFGILGFVSMIIGILAQAIPNGENRE